MYQSNRNQDFSNSRQINAVPTGFNEDEFRERDPELSTARVNYLRRQYPLIFIQQALAVIFIYEALSANTNGSQNKIREFLLNNWVWSFLIPLIVISLLSLVAFFVRSLIARTPVNWVSYIFFTVGFATLFAYLSVKYQERAVIGGIDTVTQDGTWIYFYVLSMAAMISFALTIHTLTTKSELTFQSASLYVVGSVLLVAFLFLVFSNMPLILSHLLTVTGIIWGFYIVWENESVVSGTKSEWSREDYIIGAIAIYLSIVTLFLRLADLIRQLITKERS